MEISKKSKKRDVVASFFQVFLAHLALALGGVPEQVLQGAQKTWRPLVGGRIPKGPRET